MNKIGIIGSYGGSSTGDEAILKGLLNCLESIFQDKVEVVIYTSNVKITKSAINKSYKFGIEYRAINNKKDADNTDQFKNKLNSTPTLKQKMGRLLNTFGESFPSTAIYIEKFLRKILKKPLISNDVFKDIDTLIFGGGNILMDLYYKWPYIVNSVITTKAMEKKKVFFLGIGAGPIHTIYGKKVFRRVCDRYYISTRDKESQKLLKHISKGNIFEGTDLAFGLSRVNNIEEFDRRGIAVSVLPYHADFYWPNAEKDKYNNYKKNMAKILDRLVKETNEKVEFFASNYPNDIIAAKEIADIMEHKENIRITEEKLTVDEILYFLSKKQFLIGTRLHSLILGSCVSTNFYAINYQPKVNAFLKSIGKERDFIDVGLLSDNILNDSQIVDIVGLIKANFNCDFSFDVIDKKRENLINEIGEII